MSIPATTVEIGFDLSALGGPFFILDDPVQGVLDNIEYTLGGTLFYDISEYVRSVSVKRGKSRQLDRFTAGAASIELDNNNRAFDPENTSSPFFGQIIPKRTIKVETGGTPVFYGVVDDWNLRYDLSGLSTTSADCVDGFTLLSQRVLTAHTATSELSGARVNAVLDRPEVNWPTSLRDIDNGATILQADVVEDGTNVYEYLQLVSDSEPGAFFVGSNGAIVFKDRTVAPAGTGVVIFSDDDTEVSFSAVNIVYGSELLYNYIQVTRNNGGTAVVQDSDSINSYGQQALLKQNLLMNTDSDALELANYLLGQYSEPEYRFETVSVQLEDLESSKQIAVLGLEIGDVAQIKFTPNNVGSQIDKYASIISINHNVAADFHRITFGFETLDYASLILDDTEFGILDTNRLGF